MPQLLHQRRLWIRLNRRCSSDDFFDDPQRQRLKGWQLSYFAFHALFGFLLGSFVVAALAGLTQTG
jgi:hypothetical protein